MEAGMAADTSVEISQRLVSPEPMVSHRCSIESDFMQASVSFAVVYHSEFRTIRELRNSWRCTYSLSSDHVDRLHTCLSTEGLDQYWMRSPGLSYGRLYPTVSRVTCVCLFPSTNTSSRYLPAYTNPNLTTWKDDYGQPIPKNSFLGQC